jgi:uncharacterized membrane protein
MRHEVVLIMNLRVVGFVVVAVLVLLVEHLRFGAIGLLPMPASSGELGI